MFGLGKKIGDDLTIHDVYRDWFSISIWGHVAGHEFYADMKASAARIDAFGEKQMSLYCEFWEERFNKEVFVCTGDPGANTSDPDPWTKAIAKYLIRTITSSAGAIESALNEATPRTERSSPLGFMAASANCRLPRADRTEMRQWKDALDRHFERLSQDERPRVGQVNRPSF